MSVSGSQLRGFRHGWALDFGTFGAGHYFRRIGATDEVISACGIRSVVRGMWGIGTFPPCRKCRKKHSPPADVRTCVDDTPLEWLTRK